MMQRISLVAVVLISLTSKVVQANNVQLPPAAKSPVAAEQSLNHFRLAPGYKLQLVASEPQVVDPVAIRFDEHGAMWVVEMRDYPNGPAPGSSPMSIIKRLIDRDNDGRYETATVFADNLLFATGLQPWNGGVIVTMAGKVVFMKDRDGDGKAEPAETWFTGFAEDNPQLRANHPTLALDNRIYVSNGLRGGEVIDHRESKRIPIPIRGMDFRFDPLTNQSEAVTGVGQFGLTFDNFGHRFVCTNRNPMKQIVLQDYHLKRNPKAAIPTSITDVAAAGDASRVFPISRAWTTSNLHAGQFTAACGVTVYRGHRTPEMTGNVFTCDPTGNLVHREIVSDDGAVFKAKPAHADIEFLSSTDEWFRPVNMENGPDGSLYIVDMYRAVIEHPQWVPDELKNRPDERYGDDRGRIYRIVKNDDQKQVTVNGLAKLKLSELADMLVHRNVWQRETAARLLLQRKAKGLGSQTGDRNQEVDAFFFKLKQLAHTSVFPVGRIRALWMLEGLGRITEADILAAMLSPDARVREHAVRLAERVNLPSQGLRTYIQALTEDRHPTVRMQATLFLAPASENELNSLVKVAAAKNADVWTDRAIQIAVGDNAALLLEMLLNEPSFPAAARSDLLIALIAQAGRTNNLAQLAGVLEATMAHPKSVQRRVLTALCQRVGLSKLQPLLLKRSVARLFEKTFKDANTTALNASLPIEQRGEAISLLAYSNQHTETLSQLAFAPNQTVRLNAINALARHAHIDPWKTLLKSFASESPAIRRGIVNGAIRRADRAMLLLDAIQAKQITAAELSRSHIDRLKKHADAQVAARAKELFANLVPADRQKVLADYQKALTLKADPKRGQSIFQKNCAICHRIGKIGVDVAPDISDSRTKKPLQILTNIIQPNRAIDNNYISYTVRTEDGQALTGILTSETATSVTLKQQEGKVSTILRSDIEQIRSTGLSLMPEGLEKNINHQDMADVISFVKNWRYLDGKTPYQRQK